MNKKIKEFRDEFYSWACVFSGKWFFNEMDMCRGYCRVYYTKQSAIYQKSIASKNSS